MLTKPLQRRSLIMGGGGGMFCIVGFKVGNVVVLIEGLTEGIFVDIFDGISVGTSESKLLKITAR